MWGYMKLSVFDGKGALINALAIESKADDNQLIELNVAKYSHGSYFVHVQ
jgi:hypothetical protein